MVSKNLPNPSKPICGRRMDKIFVIAGNKKQAKDWINNKITSMISNTQNLIYVARSNYVYVDDASRLRGIVNPHGVFIGTWKGRSDIKDIIMALMTATYETNPKLRKIWNEIYPNSAI